MTKTTVELHRIKDTTTCVGHGGIPFSQDSSTTLDVLAEWTSAPENAGRRVYRHVVRSAEENVRKEPHTWPDSNCPTIVYPRKCDHVTYLDIYWQ